MKKILITGSTGTLGNALVEALASKDVEFYLHYFNDEKRTHLESITSTLSCKSFFLKADFTDESQAKDMASQILKAGGVDIIIHCVSLPIQRNEILKKEWSDFKKHISLQVGSLFFMTKQLIPMMKEKKSGKIISILTEYIIGIPPSAISDYVMAKYALLGFSKCIASEYGKYGITCNCVSPGVMETDLTKDLPGKFKEIIISQTPLNRLTTPKDVASLIKYLCSEEASFITGENILVNGGHVMN